MVLNQSFSKGYLQCLNDECINVQEKGLNKTSQCVEPLPLIILNTSYNLHNIDYSNNNGQCVLSTLNTVLVNNRTE